MKIAVGKDEVGGSNPPSSSRKHLNPRILGVLIAFLHNFVWVTVWVKRLTHTVTHTAKCPERFRKHRTGSLGFLSVTVKANGDLSAAR